MNKRETAIASVMGSLDGRVQFDALYQLSMDVVDRLIEDGVIALSYAGDPDVAGIVDHFQMVMGTTSTIRTDRFAAARLGKRYGAGEVCKVIMQLSERKKEKYAPTVNNLTQLEQKWPQVIRFVQSKGEDEVDV